MPKRDGSGSPMETFQDFHFPKAGVDRARAFGRQPVRQGLNGVYVRTTCDALNVKGYDPTLLRDRGGSRAGLSKWIAARVNGEFITQHLDVLVVTEQAGGMAQLSQSGRIVVALAVSQGVVKVANPDSTAWTAVTNNTGLTPALNFTGLIYSAANNQRLYFADGTNWVYYSAKTNSLETWAATAVTGGTLPVDSAGNKPRLIATWRGRTCLSGLFLDPQNIFMSAVSDPHDFNYAPVEPSAAQAVALNLSEFGLIGDMVTALVPYTDDIMVVGCDHSIRRITGDPMAGGVVDLISDEIGFAWASAWCKDPFGNLYFFSNKCGVFKMDPRSLAPPVPISQPIDLLLKNVDTGLNVINMIWNERFQEIQIFITPGASASAATHYALEMRTGAWWPVKYANNDHNPCCCVALDGNDPNDRRLLIGSWDGYVRMLDPTASTDDGTPISSFVWIGPILTQEQDEMLLKDIQALLALGSGDITYEIHVGDTAEQALASTATVSGTWSASRNHANPIRRSGHAIYIKLSATTKWAMESIRARFAGQGKVRRRA